MVVHMIPENVCLGWGEEDVVDGRQHVNYLPEMHGRVLARMEYNFFVVHTPGIVPIIHILLHLPRWGCCGFARLTLDYRVGLVGKGT